MKRTNLFIKTYKNFFLELVGNHASKYSGSGLEFKDLREYNSGDDIRHINWKVTAKVREPIVNEFYEHKQINLIFVLLNSGSLYFGSYKQKIQTAYNIFLLLNNSAVFNKDRVKSIIFSYDIEKEYINVNQKSLKYLQQDISQIKTLNKNIDYNKLIKYLLNIKQKSIVFLIGDFFDEVDFKLLSKKHELNIIIVRDRFEENPLLLGEFNLLDTNSNIEAEFFLEQDAINDYKKALKEFEIKFFNHLYQNNIRYKKIYTSDNELIKLKEFL